MDIPQAILDFITELERDLAMSFSKKYTADAIFLEEPAANLALVIYLANNRGRIPMDNRRTFHIDQDQILKDPRKILSRLCSLLGEGYVVYGRQTVVARVDKGVAIAFLEENHLQIAVPGKYRYGLFYKGELMSIAIFSGGRHMRDQAPDYRSFELVRFCHKAGYRVVGGLSKLLKAFIKDFKPHDIMTYVDRDWAQDSNLRTLGFEQRGHIAPQHFWVVGHQRHYITNPETLLKLREDYPAGYLSVNNGSTKLVLKL